jgi:tRNA-2-methylthio-N6-dimethylallyladenosine synthase
VQLTGRTNCDRIVVFEGHRRLIGQFLDVAIYDANAFTLFGSVVTRHVGPEVYTLGFGTRGSGPTSTPSSLVAES